MHRPLVWILFLGLPTSVCGQSKPVQTGSPTQVSKPDATPKPRVAQPRYLSAALDLTLTSLGPRFAGNDINAIYRAVAESPSLKPKSEFESTSDSIDRHSEFVNHPLFGTLMPNSFLGFVIDDDFGEQFKYDADLQTMAVTLFAGRDPFAIDEKDTILDTVPVRTVVTKKDHYIGSNIFRRKAEISRTYSDEYWLLFSRYSWLFFRRSQHASKFTYMLAMTSDEAKAFKPDLRILFVCRLEVPWFRESAHGHDPTINEPWDTAVLDHYLAVEPEQLWIFNQKTGEVIRKISKPPLATEQ